MTVAHKPKDRWSREDKLAVIAALVTLGSQKKAAKLTGVPQTTISWWYREDSEFQDLLAQTQAEVDRELPIRFAHYLDKALERIGERLEDKDSAASASLSHLATLVGIFFDKRQIALSRPTSISGKATEIEEQLERNAQALVASVKRVA